MQRVTKLQPRQRIVVVCDVEGSTTRTNPAKAALRADMYDVLKRALEICGITEDRRERFVDWGDGIMTLLRPVDEVPKTLLLDTFAPAVSAILAEHAISHPRRAFRQRMAIHSGDIHFDGNGTFGEDIDIAFRLVNAPELKERLRQTDEPLVLAVSDHIHRSVVRHGYDGIDCRTFQPEICLEVAGQRYTGWVQVPSRRMPPVDRVS